MHQVGQETRMEQRREVIHADASRNADPYPNSDTYPDSHDFDLGQYCGQLR